MASARSLCSVAIGLGSERIAALILLHFPRLLIRPRQRIHGSNHQCIAPPLIRPIPRPHRIENAADSQRSLCPSVRASRPKLPCLNGQYWTPSRQRIRRYIVCPTGPTYRSLRPDLGLAVLGAFDRKVCSCVTSNLTKRCNRLDQCKHRPVPQPVKGSVQSMP